MLQGSDALLGNEELLPRSPGCWGSILLCNLLLTACTRWYFCIIAASFILFSFCMETGNWLLLRLLGKVWSEEPLESLQLAGDELKLCDKLFLLTADRVMEGKTGVFPEVENIPDDVIAARCLTSANGVSSLVLFMSRFEPPIRRPPFAAVPKDGKLGFIATGKKGFVDVTESREFCNSLKPANRIICCL